MKNSPKTPPLPSAPPGLSAEASAWWAKILGAWSLEDGALLELQGTLEAFDRMRQAQDILKKSGPVVKDRFGQEKMHPAVLIERDARSAMMAGLKQLHLDLEPLNNPHGRPSSK